jgi:hypothetical protein
LPGLKAGTAFIQRRECEEWTRRDRGGLLVVHDGEENTGARRRSADQRSASREMKVVMGPEELRLR